MTARKHSDLRSLALAYYWGWISREKYIDMRKSYLQSISEGKQPKPIKPQDLAPPKKKSPAAQQSKSGSKLITSIIFVVIVAVAIAFYFIFTGGEEPMHSTGSQPAQGTPGSSLSVQTETSTPESLFSDYLNKTFIQNPGEWKADSLSVLKFKWQGLSQEQQVKLREDGKFKEFSQILIGKIAQERSLNNVVPSDKELTLMTAARNLDLLDQLPAE